MAMDELIRKLTGKRGELLDKFVEHDIQVEQKAAQRRADAYEGIVHNETEPEKDKIKKLTERLPEDELDADTRDEKPLREPPDEIRKSEDEAEVENEKEYFGKKEDIFYYLITDEEEGERDLRIVDQDGNVVFSAKENDLDTADVFHFILEAVTNVEPSEISYDIFVKYVKPKIEELEQEDEPEFDDNALDSDAPVKEPFGVPAKESVDEVKVQFSDHDFIVNIVEDAKNTVLEINGRQFRFDEKFTDFFKSADSNKLTEDDITELAKYVLSSLDKDEFEEISKAGIKADEARKDIPKKDKKKKKKNAKESTIDEAELLKEINVVTQGIKQLTKTAKTAMKAKDYGVASDASARLAAIHDALPEIEEPKEEDKEEDKVTDEIVEPVEGKVHKETESEKVKIDKLTEEDDEKPEEEKKAEKDNPGDEVNIDKKPKKKSGKKAPTCSKCNNTHWPFQGCKDAKKKD